jgi:hypothetical protein
MMTKRGLYCTLAALLGLVLTTALLWFYTAHPALADPNVRHVAETGTDGSNDCKDPGTPCRTIQHAIDVADPDDAIHVAGGTYTSTAGPVAVITKPLAIVGSFDLAFTDPIPEIYQTILDADWKSSVISTTGAGTLVLEFLTLTEGNGTGNCGSQGCGGGIHATDTFLHVSHCIIVNNVASTSGDGLGGGIYINNWFGAPVEIWESQIVGNTASVSSIGWGGGLYLQGGDTSAPTIIGGNTFICNTASASDEGQGGGIFLYASPETHSEISHNIFSGNIGSGASGWGGGGGLYIWVSNDTTLEANQFLGNIASISGNGYGGAIYAPYTAAFTMTNSLLAGNSASVAGGGMWMGTSYHIAGTLVNNTLADNDTGAGGEGIWVGQSVSLTLTNNIIADHTVGITNTQPASSIISADTNLFWNTTDPIIGTNAILEDPLLAADYRPLSGSPAADEGLIIPWLTADLEGTTRPQGGAYDIGAFEGKWWDVFLPLVSHDSQ